MTAAEAESRGRWVHRRVFQAGDQLVMVESPLASFAQSVFVDGEFVGRTARRAWWEKKSLDFELAGGQAATVTTGFLPRLTAGATPARQLRAWQVRAAHQRRLGRPPAWPAYQHWVAPEWILRAELSVLFPLIVLSAMCPLCLTWPGTHAWGERLQSGDPAQRAGALRCLGEDPPDPEPGAKLVARSLSDPEPLVREWALDYFVNVYDGPSWRRVEAFLALADDPDDVVMERAATLLGQLGDRALPVVPRLRALAAEGTARQRCFATVALSHLGMTNPEALAPIAPLIRRLQRDDDPLTRKSAIWVLASLGDRSPFTVLTWARALRDPDARVASQASLALSERGPEVVPALLPLFADPNRRVRLRVAWTCSNLGAGAAPLVNALIPLLGDRDDEVRSAAIEALARVGGQVGVAGLREWVRERRAGWQAALRALGSKQVGEPTRRVLADVLLTEPSTSSAWAWAASSLLPKQVAGAESIYDALLQHPSPEWREFALARLGGQAQAFGGLLERIEGQLSDPDVGPVAAWAISRIDPSRRDAMICVLAARASEVNASFKGRLYFEEIVTKGPPGVGAPAWAVIVCYRVELALLGLLTCLWYSLARRIPAQRPASLAFRALHAAVVGLVPAAAWTLAIVKAGDAAWVDYVFAEASLTLLPFRVSAGLSALFGSALIGIWVTTGPEVPPSTEEGASPDDQGAAQRPSAASIVSDQGAAGCPSTAIRSA